MGAAYRNCRYIAKSLPIVKAKRATMSTNTGAKVKPEKSCRIAYNYETHFFWDSGYNRVIRTPVENLLGYIYDRGIYVGSTYINGF